MRRSDRQVTDTQGIIAIIEKCKVMRLAMSADNMPYIVPLNFGYTFADNTFEFYFHCANEGKKLDILRANSNVCFEMDCEHKLTGSGSPCSYGYNYQSIIGSGKAEIVADTAQKKRLLQVLMKHQTGLDFQFDDTQANSVTVCKIICTDITAKARQI